MATGVKERLFYNRVFGWALDRLPSHHVRKIFRQNNTSPKHFTTNISVFPDTTDLSQKMVKDRVVADYKAKMLVSCLADCQKGWGVGIKAAVCFRTCVKEFGWNDLDWWQINTSWFNWLEENNPPEGRYGGYWYNLFSDTWWLLSRYLHLWPPKV